MCNILPDTVKSPLDILRYVHANRLHELLPNVSVALRILLTVPVTVASGERSFSKLKLIKTYLRANMTQQRLAGLVWQCYQLKMGLHHSSTSQIY